MVLLLCFLHLLLLLRNTTCKSWGRIRGFGDAAQEPEKFPTSPALAIPKALERAGLSKDDVDLYEINEAFSVVSLANQQLMELKPDQVNIHGGAVSIGHPTGASGARIIISLLTGLALKNLNIGAASICNGGGGASALILERDPGYRIDTRNVASSYRKQRSVIMVAKPWLACNLIMLYSE